MKKLLLSLCLLGTLAQAQTLIEKEFATSPPMSMSDATVLPDGSFMLVGYAFPQGQDSLARLDVSGLSSGIYWLELKIKSQVLQHKFIKK